MTLIIPLFYFLLLQVDDFDLDYNLLDFTSDNEIDLKESLEHNTAQDVEMVENIGFHNDMAFSPLAATQMIDNLWNDDTDSDSDDDDYEYLSNEVS